VQGGNRQLEKKVSICCPMPRVLFGGPKTSCAKKDASGAKGEKKIKKGPVRKGWRPEKKWGELVDEGDWGGEGKFEKPQGTAS